MNSIKHSLFGLLGLGLVLATPGRGRAAEATIAPAATNLIETHLQAIGGRAALGRITNLVFKGTGREGMQEFSTTLALKAPGFMLLTMQSAEGVKFQHARDPQARLWSCRPDGVRDVTDPQDQGVILDLIMAASPFGYLRMAELYGGGASALVWSNNHTYYMVREKTETTPRLWFDAESGRLARVGLLTLEDYREVGGIKLPHALRMNNQISFEFTEVKLNPDLPDSMFERPKGVPAAPPLSGQPRFKTLTSATGKLEIVRTPGPLQFRRGKSTQIGHWDPKSLRPDQVDLRSYDLSALDLQDRLTDLEHALFDNRTRWPAQLPVGFEPPRIMDVGRNPGLGVRAVHARGITGRGVGIGIVDQPLLVNHQEYRDRLRLYEEIHSQENGDASMHGPAVTSIAAGKTIGVAPGAELYYVAEWHQDNQGELDFTPLAQAVNRLLDVNATLPAGHKLRVISISVGWSPDMKGGAAADAAVQRAQRDGVFVITSALERHYNLKFHGLGRELLPDPDRFESYGLGSWWANTFWNGTHRFAPGERLLVPMDARTTAGPTGPEDYAFYAVGGWSWSVPWIAGLYALACEAKPDITPQEFWATALKTGRTVKVTLDKETAELGTIADPMALIQALKPGW
ncbi:MAG: S8 family serine peptidase [Verrucomicrobiota bacterium]|jgi:hypothetical protein